MGRTSFRATLRMDQASSRLARTGAAWAGAALLAAGAAACVVGTPPWIAPALRLLYSADGAGRAGIRFLVARQDNEIAITRTPGDASPSYDRAGGWVYFVSRDGEASDLYRVRLSGEERTQLTRTPMADESWPVPAPDGSALFYTSDDGGTEQIWRSDPEGGDPAPLTRGPEPHSRAVPDSAGTTLVGLRGGEGAWRLVRVEVATGATTPIEEAAAMPPVGRPSVRGDGSILYECGGGEGGDICRFRPGEGVRRLTEGAPLDRSPVWSPDGRLIAFSSNRDGDNFGLYAMRADGSKLNQLTEKRGTEGQPWWVP